MLPVVVVSELRSMHDWTIDPQTSILISASRHGPKWPNTWTDAAEIYKAIGEAQSSFLRVQLLERTNLVNTYGREEGSNTDQKSYLRLYMSQNEVIRQQRFSASAALSGVCVSILRRITSLIFLQQSLNGKRRSSRNPTLQTTMMHLPNSPTLWDWSREGRRRHISTQEEFFYQMTVWELEELECVWYHFGYQNKSLWRRPCKFCGCVGGQEQETGNWPISEPSRD